MSATTGMPERSAMARVMSRCWVIDTTLTSGTPYIAESSKPDAQIASKPASAASIEIALDALVSLRGERIGAPALDLEQLVELRGCERVGRRQAALRYGER